MKVYQSRGKFPFQEVAHIKSLLGALYQGHNAYDPGHENEDATIVLKPVSKGMKDWRQQVQDILERDGYEVEIWG